MESSSQSIRLQEVIAAYLQNLADGQTPDREQLVGNHPDQADDL